MPSLIQFLGIFASTCAICLTSPYQVGSTSDLSPAERRAILHRVFEAAELPFVDSSEYMRKWGRRLSHQRLWRMASHIWHLLNGPVGRDRRKPQTRRDWSNDHLWLKSEYYVPRRFRFKWPDTEVHQWRSD